MNANSNLPQLDDQRLEQMINLALSHAQDPKPASALTRGSWAVTDWLRRPALIPIPVRAFAIIAVLAVGVLHLMPVSTQTNTQQAETQIADSGSDPDVDDYMILDLLDQLS